MKTVYLALPLTQIKTDAEKNEIRNLIRWFRDNFDVEILKWAFNTDTWTPEPVENIFDFDTEESIASGFVDRLLS
jgi:hypothetical protein